jgi:alpha-methylacyl-CoA racemase
MRPLEGIRVLDLSRLIPGPFGTLVLSELGAQVDKVEDAGLGDYLRYVQPQKGGTAVAFAALNRGKRSAVVNLKSEPGRAAFERLLGHYDVLFEQFRPGVLDRLGLGHEYLRKKHPKLIICALTGYGQSGPLANRAGHDLNYLARAGLLGFQGPAGSPPQVPGFQMADVSGGMWCTIAILAALRRRDATGEGEICDIAMTDGVLGFAALQLSAALCGDDVAAGNEVLTGGIAPYNTYVASDGVAMTLASIEPKFWTKFCAAVGLTADLDALVPGDHQAALKEKIAAIFAGTPSSEWRALAAEHDFMVEPVLRAGDIADDEHLKARKLFFTQERAGETLPMFRTPVGDPQEPGAPAPDKGEHTEQMFAEAGFSADEIAELKSSGAIV